MNDGGSGERGSGISVLPARHDDDDIKKMIWLDLISNLKNDLLGKHNFLVF